MMEKNQMKSTDLLRDDDLARWGHRECTQILTNDKTPNGHFGIDLLQNKPRRICKTILRGFTVHERAGVSGSHF